MGARHPFGYGLSSTWSRTNRLPTPVSLPTTNALLTETPRSRSRSRGLDSISRDKTRHKGKLRRTCVTAIPSVVAGGRNKERKGPDTESWIWTTHLKEGCLISTESPPARPTTGSVFCINRFHQSRRTPTRLVLHYKRSPSVSMSKPRPCSHNR